MATQPIRTHTAKQLIEQLDEMRHDADLHTDGEMDSFTRSLWVAKRDTWDIARTMVRSLLPYVEVDAAQLVKPGIGLHEAEALLGDYAVEVPA